MVGEATTPNLVGAISSKARRLLDILGPLPLHSHPPSTPPSLTLPEPQPITLHLISKGIKRSVAERVSRSFVEAAMQLKLEHERNLDATVRSCLDTGFSFKLDTNISGIRSAYAARYAKSLHRCVDMVVNAAMQHDLAVASSEVALVQTADDAVGKRLPFEQVRLMLLLNAKTCIHMIYYTECRSDP